MPRPNFLGRGFYCERHWGSPFPIVYIHPDALRFNCRLPSNVCRLKSYQCLPSSNTTVIHPLTPPPKVHSCFAASLSTTHLRSSKNPTTSPPPRHPATWSHPVDTPCPSR